MKIVGQSILMSCLVFSAAAMAAEPVAPSAQIDAAKEAPKEKVKIFVLRSGKMAGGPNEANVWLNEVPAGAVAAGEILAGETDAGKVTVRVKPGGSEMVKVSKRLEIEAAPGESYYVFANQTVFAGYKLSLVSKDETMKIQEKYKRLIDWRKASRDRLDSGR